MLLSYSEKESRSQIKKIVEKVPEVKYFVKMYSEEGINGKNVGNEVFNRGRESTC